MEKPYINAKQYINEHRDEMFAMWKDFVETPSQARDRAVAVKMKDKLCGIMRQMGMDVAEHDVGPVNSPMITAYWGADRLGKPILFAGHYDTVNSSPVDNAEPGAPNEFDGTPHFRTDEENAYGLGVLDMKGGIVIALWIIKTLQSLGWAERPIKVLLAGDEDKGHQSGNTPELIVEHSRGCLCCFNMETGRVENDICVGRKGGGQGDIEIEGVASHAGNEFLAGRNAVLEMSYKIAELAQLTDLDQGTTVAPTVIKGGTVPNGIPAHCTLAFDVRYEKTSEKHRLLREFEHIEKENHIDGTKTTLKFREFIPPFDRTDAGEALADFVADVSRRQGFGDMGKVFLGGSSDASYIALAGVPTICSMGVRGRYNHSSKEYAQIESLYERAQVLACAVLDIEKYAAVRECK